MFFTGQVSDALPADLPASAAETTPWQRWYRCDKPPRLVKELVHPGVLDAAVGPVAGLFDATANRTSFYAVYWGQSERWVLVDLRRRPRIVLTDNGARRRLFHRIDTLLTYVERLLHEGL